MLRLELGLRDLAVPPLSAEDISFLLDQYLPGEARHQLQTSGFTGFSLWYQGDQRPFYVTAFSQHSAMAVVLSLILPDIAGA